jgi:hypothetical protein
LGEAAAAAEAVDGSAAAADDVSSSDKEGEDGCVYLAGDPLIFRPDIHRMLAFFIAIVAFRCSCVGDEVLVNCCAQSQSKRATLEGRHEKDLQIMNSMTKNDRKLNVGISSKCTA